MTFFSPQRTWSGVILWLGWSGGHSIRSLPCSQVSLSVLTAGPRDQGMDCHGGEPDRGHPLCLNDPTGTMGRIMGRYGTPRGRQIGLWERPLSHMIWPNRWLFLSLGWWMLISIRGDLKRHVFFQPPPQSYRCRILIWLPWCKEMLYVRCIWGLKSILKFIISTLTFLTWLPLMKNISRPSCWCRFISLL
jgi:hypothetical protein